MTWDTRPIVDTPRNGLWKRNSVDMTDPRRWYQMQIIDWTGILQKTVLDAIYVDIFTFFNLDVLISNRNFFIDKIRSS